MHTNNSFTIEIDGTNYMIDLLTPSPEKIMEMAQQAHGKMAVASQTYDFHLIYLRHRESTNLEISNTHVIEAIFKQYWNYLESTTGYEGKEQSYLERRRCFAYGWNDNVAVKIFTDSTKTAVTNDFWLIARVLYTIQENIELCPDLTIILDTDDMF